MKKNLSIFLLILCLIVSMVAVLAIVESKILGNNARIILYSASLLLMIVGSVGWWLSSHRKAYLISGIFGMGILAAIPVAFIRRDRDNNLGHKNPFNFLDDAISVPVSNTSEGPAIVSGVSSIEDILYKDFPNRELSSSQSASRENREYQEYLSESLRDAQERDRINSDSQEWRVEQRRIVSNREAATLKREQAIRERALEVINQEDPVEKERMRKKFESDVRRIKSLPLRNRTVEVANQAGYVFSWEPDWNND